MICIASIDTNNAVPSVGDTLDIGLKEGGSPANERGSWLVTARHVRITGRRAVFTEIHATPVDSIAIDWLKRNR